MSDVLLSVLIAGTSAAVIVALFLVLWYERESPRQASIAIASAIVLALWAVITGLLAYRGSLRPPNNESVPPIGIALAVALAGLALCLVLSRSLRQLLSNQKHLIALNVWRVLGVVFLVLMARWQMPALWALPAGIGDIIVGITAPWVAKGLDEPGGSRRAIIFNLFGIADLIVAIGLGITTNPGRLQVFHTTPSSELVTGFPLALVPAFLVPLAFMLHVVSLWQLLNGTWAPGAMQMADSKLGDAT